jgi:hypothetical protein
MNAIQSRLVQLLKMLGIPADDDQRSDLMPIGGSRVMAIRIPG